MSKMLLLELERESDFIPLFLSSPLSPLFHFENKKTGKHIYWGLSDDGKMAFYLCKEEPIESLKFPKMLRVEEINLLPIKSMQLIEFEELLDVLEAL